MDIQYYKAQDLIMAEYNPRQLTKDQYTQLKDSIERFGLVDHLIVNKNKDRKNILVGGHQRLRIARKMGMVDIPCVEVDLKLDQEKELNIRLNKNVGEWDYDSLANYFDVGELMDWGFSDDELQFYEDEPEQGLIDDDEIPEVEEAITKQGDLWILGEHRVLCGDATKKEDVERLMDGQKADMVFTDPPYGMDLNTNYKNIYKNSIAEVKNQKRVIGDNKQFNPTFILNYFKDTKEQFWWGFDYYMNLLQTGGVHVWDKVCESMEGRIGNEFELCWSKQKHKKEIIHIKWAGFIGLKKDDGKRKHPTQKPIRLCTHFIKKFSKEQKIIIDPFIGSGSTLIACEKTNRKCYGMELDPHYCDVIVKRWEEFTGKKAERVEAANA